MPSALPPGPSGPLRNTFKWMFRVAELLDGAHARYGDIWTLRLLAGTTMVVISHPKLIEQAYQADGTALHAGKANRFIGTALLGENSVILLDEPEHMVQRKLLMPHFGHDRVARYHELMVYACEEELASWPLRTPIDLLPRMQAITRKVIMGAIFGVTGREAEERLGARIKAILAYGEQRRKMAKLHHATRKPDKALPKSFVEKRAPLDAAVYEEIERAKLDPRLEERDDILAMLVQARHDDGSPMTDLELRDEMVTLLIQGHSSTATALAWAVERLVHTPGAHERLAAEVETDGDEYLDAVIKETLRLRPPIPIVARYVTEPIRLGEYDLEPGTLVAPCMYLLHRREDVYLEPELFRPERFLESPPPPSAWIPFGGTSDRHCIGRGFAMSEMREVLRMLTQRLRLAPAAPRDEKIRKRGILLSPSDGARVVVTERVPQPARVKA